MRKVYFVLSLILILLLASCTTNKKDEFKPLGIDKLISYRLSKKYKVVEKIYYKDDNKTLIEKSYGMKDDERRFTIRIFSYKNKDLISDYVINADDYINYMTHKKEMKIKGYKFFVGYTGQDDFEDVIARAYVRYNDYVLQISMSNSDDFITDKQYEDFIKIIKTIEFK